MHRVRTLVTAGTLGALAALVLGTFAPTTATAAVTSAAAMRAATSASLYGAGAYRSDTSEAAKQATALASTDPSGAAAARTIAQYPVATWLGDWSQGTILNRTIDAAVAGADRSGTTAVFVTYAIPNRDCGGYSAGGFDERTYDAWVDQIVSRVTGHRAAVIVEPDSLAMLDDARCGEALDLQRYRILQREVAAFTAAGVPAYLDAGNSNWVRPADMAARLDKAGVRQARGFFTNVANYYPTANEQAYAQQVSAATGGSHYVIDTSRNGQGWRGTWCNAPGAGLGTTPRTVSDGTALDALLWVKTPGASDGTCNGGPAAGKWWSDYAKKLVANAQLGTPPSTTSPSTTSPSTTSPTPARTTGPATPATTSAAVAPIGRRDSVTAGAAKRVAVRGWAFDRDAVAQSVTVRVLVGGTTVGTTTAKVSRPDVDRVYGTGVDHGFAATVAVPSGRRSVCLVAVGIGRGGDTALGCTTVTVR